MEWMGIKSPHTLRALLEKSRRCGIKPPVISLGNTRRWRGSDDVIWEWLAQVEANSTEAG